MLYLRNKRKETKLSKYKIYTKPTLMVRELSIILT